MTKTPPTHKHTHKHLKNHPKSNSLATEQLPYHAPEPSKKQRELVWAAVVIFAIGATIFFAAVNAFSLINTIF